MKKGWGRIKKGLGSNKKGSGVKKGRGRIKKGWGKKTGRVKKKRAGVKQKGQPNTESPHHPTIIRKLYKYSAVSREVLAAPAARKKA